MSSHNNILSAQVNPFRRILASVDPPGTQQDLPLHLTPKFGIRRGNVPEEDLRFAAEALPLQTLNRNLIPRTKLVAKPPVLHYAWRANVEELMRYAEDNDLVYYCDDDDVGPPGVKDEFLSIIQVVDAKANTIPHYPMELLQIRYPMKIDDGPIISLYTNYDIARAPPDDLVQQLGERLGVKESPQWYIDFMKWNWRIHGDRQSR